MKEEGHKDPFSRSPLQAETGVKKLGFENVKLERHAVDFRSEFWGWNCELSFPLQSPGSPRGGNPRKMGKNYKIPLPGPTPENEEKLPKNYKKCSENTFFCNFSVFFPRFRGLGRGGGLCNFFPFFGDFRPGGLRGSVRGKTTRKGGSFWKGLKPWRNKADNSQEKFAEEIC